MIVLNLLKCWDVVDYFENSEDMVLYLNVCIDDDFGDGFLIWVVLNDIVWVWNMS